MLQLRQVCYYAPKCRMEQEPTCYRCGKKGHRASECRSKVEIPPTCTYCHQVGHTAENCFFKKSNEAVETQDVKFPKNSRPTEAKGAVPSGQNNIVFVKEDDPVEDEHTVAAFERSVHGETLTKQQRMQKDIDTYTKMQVKPKIPVRTNLDFPIIRRVPKKNRKGVRKSASKMVIAVLAKRVEKYDLINNLAQAQTGITLGHIARGDIDFAKKELQKILSSKMGRTIVSFAGKDEVRGVSMSRHLLVRVLVYSESMMALFDSGAIPNVMSHKMANKIYLRRQPTNRCIKVANCASEKCVGTLNEVLISMGELVVPMDFLVLEETPYDILIGLPTMIQLRSRTDYYRVVLKIHYGGDSEILNYEYERDSGKTSEDEHSSDSADENEQEIEESVEELGLMLNEPEKKTESSDEHQLLDEKLSHLSTKDAESV